MSKHISILDSARTVAVYTATAASLLAVYAVPAIYFFPIASSETTFCTSLFSRIGIVFFTVSLSALFFIGAYCCAATLHIHNFTYFFQKKGIRIVLPTFVAFIFLVPLLTVLAHLFDADNELPFFSTTFIYSAYAPGPYAFLGVFLFLLLLSALLKKFSSTFFRHRYNTSFQKVLLTSTFLHVVITLILICGININLRTVEILTTLIGWSIYYVAGIQAYRARIFANNTFKPAFSDRLCRHVYTCLLDPCGRYGYTRLFIRRFSVFRVFRYKAYIGPTSLRHLVYCLYRRTYHPFLTHPFRLSSMAIHVSYSFGYDCLPSLSRRTPIKPHPLI